MGRNESNTIRANVEYILSRSERARNDDKYLMLLYWNKIDGIKINNNPTFKDDFLEKMTTPGSIIRARCLIQEDGLYPPTEETAMRRRSKESNMKDAIVKDREVI